MPRHLFKYHFKCPHNGCPGSLVNAGVHQKTRMVLDVNDYYIIAGEDYECNKCKRRVSLKPKKKLLFKYVQPMKLGICLLAVDLIAYSYQGFCRANYSNI